MEGANVISSMYEGRGSKRSVGGEEEEENSSKIARMSNVNETTNGFRARNAVSNVSNNRTMMTRSMSMRTTEKKDEKLIVIAEIIDLDKEEDKNDGDDTNNKAEEEEQQQQPAVNEVVEKEEEGDVEMLTLDDWPLPWCSEEAFSWCKGYACGWYSSWEVMSGDHWLPRADSVEAACSDDLWLFKNNNESP